MIFFVSGNIDFIDGDNIIIDNNGIGYRIKIAENILPDVINFYHERKKIKLYTFLSVKEDAINLYGFLYVNDLKLFSLLINISGIGPKAALNIISNMSAKNILLAVNNEDADLLSKVPGIGKKTAQRLILELKNKINLLSDIAMNDNLSLNNKTLELKNNNKINDALEALISLGYNKSEVIKIMSEINNINDLSTQEIIKLALKLFG